MHGWSHPEWVTLQLGPFWVASALVGRDWFVEPEKAALWRAVEDRMTDPSLGGELCRAALGSRSWLLDELVLLNLPVATGLGRVSALLDRGELEDGRHARGVMLAIGTDFARARGPFGQQISRVDADVLELVEQLLESSVDLAQHNPMNEPAPT